MRSVAIADRDIEAFCRDYQTLYTEGLTIEAMVPRLRKYWTGDLKLTTAQQISNMARGVADGRAPDWYVKWWNGARLKIVRPRGVAARAPLVVEKAPPTNTAANGHGLNGHAKPAKRKADPPADEVFAALDVLRANALISAADAWSKFAEWKAKQG